jgi:hypothetical protein
MAPTSAKRQRTTSDARLSVPLDINTEKIPAAIRTALDKLARESAVQFFRVHKLLERKAKWNSFDGQSTFPKEIDQAFKASRRDDNSANAVLAAKRAFYTSEQERLSDDITKSNAEAQLHFESAFNTLKAITAPAHFMTADSVKPPYADVASFKTSSWGVYYDKARSEITADFLVKQHTDRTKAEEKEKQKATRATERTESRQKAATLGDIEDLRKELAKLTIPKNVSRGGSSAPAKKNDEPKKTPKSKKGDSTKSARSSKKSKRAARK